MVNTAKRLLGDVGTHLVVILGGMTAQLQLLVVCINKPFKDRLKQVYVDWMRSSKPAPTLMGRLKRVSPAVLCSWIAEAWATIPKDLVILAFKKMFHFERP